MAPTGCGVVTGASRGLGAALAVELVGRGFAVAGCARSEFELPGVWCAAVDMTDLPAVARFAAEVADRFGPIDAWVNNAGVLGPIGPVGSTSPEEWTEPLAVNVLGVVAGSTALLRHGSPEAVIVNIASRVGVQPAAGLGAYSTTKAAVLALTHAMEAELRQSARRVVAVIPPSIDTEMQATLLAQDPAVFPDVVRSKERRDAGRIVSPSDAAAMILRAVLEHPHSSPVIDLTGGTPNISEALPKLGKGL